jgi:hypothetical protein
MGVDQFYNISQPLPHMGTYEWNEKGEGGEDIIKSKNVVCYHIDAYNYHCHHTYNNT